MVTKQIQLWAACMTVAAVVAVVPSAQAQVGAPAGKQDQADRPNQPNRADQNQNQTNRTDVNVNRQNSNATTSDRNAKKRSSYKASELMGLNIRATNDDNVGEVKDLMINRDGKIAYAAISFGGFLGIGDKMFAVPFEALQIVAVGDDAPYAHLDVTEQTLKNRQGFDKDNWPEKADQSFMQSGGQRPVDRAAADPAAPR